MRSLANQALERVGKDWSVGSGTREAKIQTIKRFTEFVSERFGLERIENLKPGHVNAYAENLHQSGVSNRTGANYMAFVRDLCESIGKAGICARENKAFGFNVDSRMNPLKMNTCMVSEIRAQLEVRAEAGDRIALMMLSTAEMRDQYGLRQKEALMSHRVEMVEGKLCLRVEGAKGGLLRHIEVRTDGQRAAIERVIATAAQLGNANGRSIPPEIALKAAMAIESKLWHKAGGTRAEKANMHAQRHNYAQGRLADGVSKAQVNRELGHGEQRSLGSYAV